MLLSPLAFSQNAIVSADGSGTYDTIQRAVSAAPAAGQGRDLWLIVVKPGVYKEKLVIPDGAIPIKMIGEDAAKTIITYDDSSNTLDSEGKPIGTFKSASTVVNAKDLTVENITFANSFGKGSQAVAVQFAGDRGVFRHCRFTGWQDTILLKSGRSYFENCMIEGAVDFIFGAGVTWFEKCEIRCTGPGFITAASTVETDEMGYVFSNCRITGTGTTEKWQTFLGRPWRPFASVTFMHTEMPDFIRPEGWDNWRKETNEKTARFSEVDNHGPGAAIEKRVPWSRQLAPAQAAEITIQRLFKDWVPAPATN